MDGYVVHSDGGPHRHPDELPAAEVRQVLRRVGRYAVDRQGEDEQDEMQREDGR